MFVYNSNKIGNQFRIGSIDVDYAALQIQDVLEFRLDTVVEPFGR